MKTTKKKLYEEGNMFVKCFFNHKLKNPLFACVLEKGNTIISDNPQGAFFGRYEDLYKYIRLGNCIGIVNMKGGSKTSDKIEIQIMNEYTAKAIELEEIIPYSSEKGISELEKIILTHPEQAHGLISTLLLSKEFETYNKLISIFPYLAVNDNDLKIYKNL